MIVKKKTSSWMLMLGIIFLGFNLRPAITSVGPLVADIQHALTINNLQAGLITTIPLIAFALFSPFVSSLSNRIGRNRLVFMAMVLLLAGILLRYLADLGMIYFGTLVIGSGVAILNVLLPGIIKAEFPNRIGLMTSIYSTAMCGMAGIASGLSIPLAHHAGWGWNNALGVWAIMAVLGIVFWLSQLKHHYIGSSLKLKKNKGVSVWKVPTAWYISVYMGIQSFIFYCLIAWLPKILIQLGMSSSLAGWMLLYMQIIGLPATFFFPIIMLRMKKMWVSVFGIFILNLLGLILLLCCTGTFGLILAVTLLGVSTGGNISMIFAIMSYKGNTPEQAAELSGMSQSVGYILAAVGPVLLGWAFDATHSIVWPVIILLIVNCIFLYSGVKAVSPRSVMPE